MKKQYLLLVLFLSSSLFIKAQTETDITDQSGVKVIAQYDDAPDGEAVTKLIDNSSDTKTLTFHSSAWMQIQAPKPTVLTRYTITSGNDSEERDPLNWELSGSNNGVTFYKIDSRQNENFPTRCAKQDYTISNNQTSYVFYRLTMTNNSGNILQVSELELFGVEGNPFKDLFADFAINSYLVTGDSISLLNGTLNATAYSWTFKGGIPSKSNEFNPKVIYEKPGDYQLKLIAKNGKKTVKKTINITIKDVNDWSSFIYPTVTLECNNTQNLGYQKYLSLVKKKGFEDIPAYVKNCCLIIAKKLYKTVDEANEHNVRNIQYILREGGYLSYANTVIPNIEIGFDMNYLNSFAKDHSEDASADEIYGVLCHELTHGYQNWPKNAGIYGTPNECFGFIEGTADLARLLTGGFNPVRYPRVGGSFLDGYNTTGFFYLWINDTKDATFLQKLNKSAKTMNTWSLDAVTHQLFGVSAQSLWNEYQLAIPALVEKAKMKNSISSN